MKYDVAPSYFEEKRDRSPITRTPQQINQMIVQLNRDIAKRSAASNTVTFSGRLVFNGPNGNAVYGLSAWKRSLETCLLNALQNFMKSVAGATTPEGHVVEPIGFHVDLNVKQALVTPSILTLKVRK